MAGRSGTLSPISVDSANDWSPVSKYNHLADSDNPYSPSVPPTPRNQLITPPTSVTSSADGMIPNGLARPPTSNGQPSPPSSIARSSTGDGLYANSVRDRESISSRKAFMIEESLSEHYRVLKVYLGPYLRDEKGNLRPNRARDKLLRLSSVQFQELSTDVYDESIRREDERRRGGPNAPGNDIPKFLPPKNNYHPKRNQARQKLSTLPIDRFRQLATDVFYELERRFPRFMGDDIERVTSPTGSVASNRSRGPGRGPIPSSGSMGRAPPPPGYRGPPPGPGGPGYRGPPGPGLGPPGSGGEFGRPLPKTFQQNTIVPNKGTMVEDDDDNSGMDEEDDDDAFGLEDAARRSSKRTTNKSMGNDKLIADLTSQIEQLQEKAEGLESQVRERDEEVRRLKNAKDDKENVTESDKAELAEMRDDVERKLEEAQSLNDSLRSELEKTRYEASETERELRSRLEDAERSGGSGGGDDNDWKQRYEQLERELEEQQHLTDEVRREASQFLQEMRALSERSNASLEKEERLMVEITRLESEVKEWKTRYARSKTQVRHLRASSTGLASFAEDASVYARDGNFVQPDGLIKDVHLTKFQLCIDQLLQTARKSNSEAVLDCMKDTVACVRSITADVDAAGSPTSDDGEDSAKRQQKLKSRVSATANNLITASKNHVSAQGLSPVSLLDAAASHLTTSVVELVKLVRVRPTQPGEEDYENPDVRSSRLSTDYYGNGARHNRNGSSVSIGSTRYSRSAASSPRPWSTRRSEGPNGLLKGSNVNIVRESSGLEEIKNYLEDQTTDLVNSIQPLVQEIRSTPAGALLPAQSEENIQQYINDINRIVYDISFKTREAVSNTRNGALAKHSTPVVDLLEDCRGGLLSALQENETGKREKIPPLAFKIARATKELVLRVERIENRELTADMTVSNDF
ncbi:Spa2-like protein [Macrophomina phaseolina MS6]|uniref:Spa2-like protein n=1 Tax=Macrophomina phaseolina (strain MS6) TaxID=1126212 RepID=K2REZ9_MACPH|nr:Spa2-like protein [Macrophomina phaseolina MS6]